jgi:hypothetical protein
MATRIYIPSEGSAAISPALGTGHTWTNAAGTVTRVPGTLTKGATAIVTTDTWPITSGAGNSGCGLQIVVGPLEAQTISGNFKAVIQAREYNNGDNIDQIAASVYVAQPGGSLRGRLLPSAAGGPHAGTTSEMISNPSHRNKRIASVAMASVAAQEGDYLVIELGARMTGTGSSPEFSFKIGEDGADLSENETDTANGAAWIEFSGDIALLVTEVERVIVSSFGL